MDRWQRAVADGSLSVDGAWVRTTNFFGPAGCVEFRATFGAATFQNAGFGRSSLKATNSGSCWNR